MRVDVPIIGGGAIGTAAAYFLRSHPRTCRVAVIERDTSYQLASTPRASGGARRLFSLPENIALSNYSIPFFERFDSEMAVHGESAAAANAEIMTILGNIAIVLRTDVALAKKSRRESCDGHHAGRILPEVDCAAYCWRSNRLKQSGTVAVAGQQER